MIYRMASSAQKLHLSTPHAATAAPPPTPSAQASVSSDTTTTTSEALFHLLHRLPPTLALSLPKRRSSAATATPPVICLSDSTPSLYSAATQHGFFQLTPHTIPSHLPLAAESSAVSLFNLPLHQKQSLFPNNWPLGYDSIDDEDDGVSAAGSGSESFCLDSSSCSTESADESNLDLGSLREFIHEMEKLGMEVMEELASAGGFQNQTRDDPSRPCSMMWISNGSNDPGRVYPYIVGLHYQVRCQRYSLLSDSGWVNVSGQVDSVLVTLGDIAQVWSNGKLKKVRGRPMATMEDINSNCITMSLLITLPLESTVSPLIPNLALDGVDEQDDENRVNSTKNSTAEERIFNPFSFEDYAWRVFHERLLLKDPLIRYRV